MFNFERLDVWQKAVAFAALVYRSTRGFPADEKFGLTNQIRRAATSISSNIAEGAARSGPDFAKFLTYATGSLYEVVTQASIAQNEGFMDGIRLPGIVYECGRDSPNAQRPPKVVRRVVSLRSSPALSTLNPQLSTS